MAKLRVLDKVGLGEFIISLAQADESTKAAFAADAANALSRYVVIPPDRTNSKGETIKHKVEVVFDDQDTTYIVLPWKDDVDRAMDHIEEQTNIYPLEYRPGTPEYIDDGLFPKKALFFRFGEYMFGRCKHG